MASSRRTDLPAKAGLHEDDKIIAMDGKPLESIEAMIERLQQTKDKPVDLTVASGQPDSKFPRCNPVLSPTEDPKEQRYRLGFLNKDETRVTTLPFSQALSLSLDQNQQDTRC